MEQSILVLVVEDEPMLLLMAGSVVEEAGFQPVYAANAEEAVRILERRTDIRIVFTDVDMPGAMDGVRLAAAIRDRWPPIEIIVVSGHHTVDLDDLPHGSRFFQKPYDSQHLMSAMIEMAA
jgi:DNA-binding NtrC family response regulator